MESMSPKRSGLPRCRPLSAPSPPTWTFALIWSRRQKKLIAEAGGGIVAEGRDITTVVAPDADVRVLLVADPAARVARRHAELAEHEIDVDDVHDQVIRRDRDDSIGRGVRVGGSGGARRRLDIPQPGGGDRDDLRIRSGPGAWRQA